jgi:hypothetical protein
MKLYAGRPPAGERGSDEWAEAQVRRVFATPSTKYLKLICICLILAERAGGPGDSLNGIVRASSLSIKTVKKYLRLGLTTGMVEHEHVSLACCWEPTCWWRIRVPS